jgi:hypothetical protein
MASANVFDGRRVIPMFMNFVPLIGIVVLVASLLVFSVVMRVRG